MYEMIWADLAWPGCYQQQQVGEAMTRVWIGLDFHPSGREVVVLRSREAKYQQVPYGGTDFT